ncbi:DUF899 domain-containing protein [Actinocrispum sp. NPDC049592]|uniref:DUF899 domain-containing protein n=1 Tax=Actinocrispum sp. NPDC049592 TaxID=3154835 RepID=UPI00342A3D3F
MSLPEVVTRDQWQQARDELLLKEKAATRARDVLNADRRRLPMVEIGKDYVFEGDLSLADLFEGRMQLIVYHFMYAPEWDAGCRSCSAFLDQIGHLAHLNARGTTFASVSRAPQAQLDKHKQRMGWSHIPWYSSNGSDFNEDFHATRDDGEYPGISVFLRDAGGGTFHTYSTYARGLDGLGSTTTLLDLTPLGRQEAWEEPKGRATGLGAPAGSPALKYHDEY